MANGIEIKGMDKVLKNLNKEIKGIENRSIDGLLSFAVLVQKDSSERVPVEFGNLKASSFARKAIDDDMAVEVGFSSKYALYVHENLEQKLKGKDRQSGLGKYWGPKGEPKFLERSLRDNKDKGLKIIQRKAKVRK